MEYTDEQYKRINLTRAQCEGVITEGHSIALWEEVPERNAHGEFIAVEPTETPEKLDWDKYFNKHSRNGVISAYQLREWLRY